MAWADVPRNLRDHPQVLGDYAGYLQEFGQDHRAEQLLRDALRKQWDPDLDRNLRSARQRRTRQASCRRWKSCSPSPR